MPFLETKSKTDSQAGQSQSDVSTIKTKGTSKQIQIPGAQTNEQTEQPVSDTTTTGAVTTTSTNEESSPLRTTIQTDGPKSSKSVSSPFTVIQTQDNSGQKTTTQEDVGIRVQFTLILRDTGKKGTA